MLGSISNSKTGERQLPGEMSLGLEQTEPYFPGKVLQAQQYAILPACHGAVGGFVL